MPCQHHHDATRLRLLGVQQSTLANLSVAMPLVTSENGQVVSKNLLASATVIRGLFVRRKTGKTPRSGQKGRGFGCISCLFN